MGSPSFAEVLADALGGIARPAPATRATPAAHAQACATAPPHPFLFASVPLPPRARAVAVLAALAKRIPHSRRPARTLTAEQRHSLAALNDLGAQLTADFTAPELRRAYRWLAHRVHPDRQHDCSEAERERRSRQFAEATGHYRRLKAIADPW